MKRVYPGHHGSHRRWRTSLASIAVTATMIALAVALTPGAGAQAANGQPAAPVQGQPQADTISLAPAPAGFDARREKIPSGKVETVEYDSKVVGIKRQM